MARVRASIFPGPQNLGLFAAESQGFFGRRGIDPDIRVTAGSADQRRALAAGKIDVAHAAVDNAVHMVESGESDAVIVSGGSNGMNELVVRPEVSRLDDLRGRTVVVDAPDTAYAFQLYCMLEMNGIRRSDYRVFPAGGASQRLHAMREDTVSAAAMLNPPWNFIAERGGFRRLGRATDAVGPYQADGAFVLRPWAAENGDVLVRYLQALIEGTRWAFAHPHEAVGLLASRLAIEQRVAEASVEAAVGPSGGLARDAAFDMAGFRNVLAIRGRMTSAWTGAGPAPEKYLDLSSYERARATL